MRRSIPALIAFTAALGLAGPAHAAERPPADETISLACEAVTTDDGKPAIHCEWDAVDGAAAYRVMGVMYRGHGREVKVREVTETSATKEAKPGTYLIGVKAVDEDGDSLGRSNRVRVTIERPTRGGSSSGSEASFDVREPVSA